MRRGTFEIQLVGQGFLRVPCFVSGPFAVHRPYSGGMRLTKSRVWTVSHAATGLAIPYFHPRTLAEAERICLRLAKAIRWSEVKRGRKPGSYKGVTPQRVARLHKAVRELGWAPSWWDAA